MRKVNMQTRSTIILLESFPHRGKTREPRFNSDSQSRFEIANWMTFIGYAFSII